jgi:hypothetical protein
VFPIEALAAFFRVDPRYFTDDVYCAELDKELDFRSTCMIEVFSGSRRGSRGYRDRLKTMLRRRWSSYAAKGTLTRTDFDGSRSTPR